MPLLSVIMPVYNSGKYLEKTIESILNQTFHDFELIIVDDGSNDGTDEKCDYYSNIDKRIKVFHQNNKGICAARNFALSKVRGAYIAFCDHDDIYNRECFEKSLELMTLYNADIVKYNYSFVIEDSGKFKTVKKRYLDNNVYELDNTWNSFSNYYGSIEAVWNGIYRTELIKANNYLFNENIKFGLEDICFNLLLFNSVYKFVQLDYVGYVHYKRVSHSTSAKFNINRIDSGYIWWKCICKISEELIGEVDYLLMNNIIFDITNSLSGQLIHSNCNLTSAKKVEILHSFHMELEKSDLFLTAKKKMKNTRINILKKIFLLLFYEEKYRKLLFFKSLYKLINNDLRSIYEKGINRHRKK